MPQVVLVDDDPHNVQLLKLLLEMEGYDVITARDNRHARACITSQVNAFVIDYQLGGHETGLQLVRDIRAAHTAADPATLIIVTSGNQQWRESVLEAGANRFLLKPFPPGELTTELRNLLT